MEALNTRIKQEVCYLTIDALSDANLLSVYKESKSLKKAIQTLESTLTKYVNSETKQQIIDDYLLQLIPAGTKGVYRGNKFNEIVKNFILNLNLSDDYEICFEKKSDVYVTSEKPDWSILQRSTNKIMIGMNQLDLWSGGQQINRGSKYIIDVETTEYRKLVCVVCNEIQLTSSKNKTYQLFEHGFKHDTLCYLNNLAPIIQTYFKLK
jgi:hypothetical protein